MFYLNEVLLLLKFKNFKVKTTFICLNLKM